MSIAQVFGGDCLVDELLMPVLIQQTFIENYSAKHLSRLQEREAGIVSALSLV